MKQFAGLMAMMCGLVVLVMGTQLAIAHHSSSMFDHAKTMTIHGTVTELRWVNPHVSLTVKGIVDGGSSKEPEEWVMEMTSPGNLVRAGGWSRNAVKEGDEVIVKFSPNRDETLRGGALKEVTLVKTGQTLTANIRMQEMPDLQ